MSRGLLGSGLGGSGFLGGSLGGGLSGLSLLSGLSGLGLGSSLGCGYFGFFLGYGLGLSLILLGFFFQSFLNVGFLVIAHLVADGFQLGVLFSLPGIEALLGFLLAEGTLLNAALQVFHQHHAFARQDVTNSVGGNCSYVHPIECTLEI